MTYSIQYTADPDKTFTKKLTDGLAEHAKQQKNLAPGEYFAFYLNDENRNITGGCSGSIFYGCLYIDLLWIAESVRSLGYGTKIMKAAEDLGREKGCLFSTVNTMSFEALGFYQKLGYHVEFERSGYLKNSTFYFLRKDL